MAGESSMNVSQYNRSRKWSPNQDLSSSGAGQQLAVNHQHEYGEDSSFGFKSLGRRADGRKKRYNEQAACE